MSEHPGSMSEQQGFHPSTTWGADRHATPVEANMYRRTVALLRLSRMRARKLLAMPVPRPELERVGRGELCPLCGGRMLTRFGSGRVAWRSCLKGHALDGALR